MVEIYGGLEVESGRAPCAEAGIVLGGTRGVGGAKRMNPEQW